MQSLQHSIETLKTRASELKSKKAELEEIAKNPELSCDLIWTKNDIENIDIMLNDINAALKFLNEKTG